MSEPKQLVIETRGAVTVLPHADPDLYVMTDVRVTLGDALRAVEAYWGWLVNVADCDAVRERAEKTFRAIRVERIGVEKEDMRAAERERER